MAAVASDCSCSTSADAGLLEGSARSGAVSALTGKDKKQVIAYTKISPAVVGDGIELGLGKDECMILIVVKACDVSSLGLNVEKVQFVQLIFRLGGE
jgi:hypothetical protein